MEGRKSYSNRVRSLSPSSINKSALQVSEKLMKDAEERKLRIQKYFQVKQQEVIKEVMEIQKDSPVFQRFMSKKKQQELTQKLLKDAELRIKRKQEKAKEKQEKEEKEAIQLSQQKFIGMRSQKLAEIRYAKQDKNDIVDTLMKLQCKIKNNNKENAGKSNQIRKQAKEKKRSASLSNQNKLSKSVKQTPRNFLQLETDNTINSEQIFKEESQTSYGMLRHSYQLNKSNLSQQVMRQKMDLQLNILKMIQKEQLSRQATKTKLKREEIQKMLQRLYEKPKLEQMNNISHSPNSKFFASSTKQMSQTQTVKFSTPREKSNIINLANCKQKTFSNKSSYLKKIKDAISTRCNSYKQLVTMKDDGLSKQTQLE